MRSKDRKISSKKIFATYKYLKNCRGKDQDPVRKQAEIMNARVCVRVQTHGHAHVHTITCTPSCAHTGPTREHSVTGLWPAGRGRELLQRAGSWRVPSRLAGIAFGRDFIMKWTAPPRLVRAWVPSPGVGDGDLCAQRWCPLGLRAPPRGLRLAPRGVLTWAFLLPVLRGGLALTQ